MRKVFLIICAVFTFNSCDEANQIINDVLSSDDVSKAIKMALDVSTDTSVKNLSALNGYYTDQAVKILLPPEAAVIFDNLALIPGGAGLVENVIMAVNRAAEDAAPEAKDIFVGAIKGMTITDAFSIVNSHDTAATVYLKDNTYTDLSAAFSPKISTSLSKPLVVGASAESLYGTLVGNYNTVANASFGILKPITTNTLGQYVTERALDGLFFKIAREEEKIRNNAGHRVNDLLSNVFGK
jgi:hypothetical protein